jgi:Bacteriophage HK97-gp10, putative tail-component
MMANEYGNFDEVNAQLNAYIAKVDTAADSAMSLIARQLYRNAYDNADQVSNTPTRVTVKRGPNKGRQYLRYNPHIGGSGTGPNRGTGTLLRSMEFSSRRVGFGSYTAQVGVGIVYARALEFGLPEWKSGVKYPYMTPALDKLVKAGQLRQILQYAFSRI